jgi:NTE family protein
MKAYAILAGGGVKGIAHAGCLAAAEDKGIEFIGFGGASAGSIVAALAAVEYSGREIREMMTNIAFTEFLEDRGAKLDRMKRFSQQLFLLNGFDLVSGWTLYRSYGREKDLLRKLYEDSGLYKAPRLEKFLEEKIMKKPAADRIAQKVRTDLRAGFTFRDLRDANYTKSLKIIASDVVSRRPVIFSTGDQAGEMDWSVTTAVRASTSYPFVFEPVAFNRNYFADGGLSSNLPVFLFEQERKKESHPILAFDLVHEVDPNEPEQGDYRLFNFCSDLLGTSLESSDKLLQGLISGLHYIPVYVPRSIDTLKFKLSEEEQTTLYQRGYEAALGYLNTAVKYWFEPPTGQLGTAQAPRVYRHASDLIKDIQRNIRVLPTIVHSLLEMVARDVEARTQAQKVRCAIMLPSENDMQVVVYHYGMDADPDIDFQMELTAGCAGAARVKLVPVIADLAEARNNPGKWGLLQEQQNKIPKDRNAGLAIPLFNVSTSISGKVEVKDNKLIGTLNIDTATPLNETGWRVEDAAPGMGEQMLLTPEVRARALFWGAVFSKLLS